MARPSDPTASSGLSNALLIGGGIVLQVGGILTYMGIAKAKQEHPINEPNRAQDVASRYNASLHALTPAGRFLYLPIRARPVYDRRVRRAKLSCSSSRRGMRR